MRFYCVAPGNNVALLAGEISPSEVSLQPTGDVLDRKHPCNTSSGRLGRVTTEPSFWKKASADLPVASRRFSMNWNCCCDPKMKGARLQTRP
jgi:hypothetical protein